MIQIPHYNIFRSVNKRISAVRYEYLISAQSSITAHAQAERGIFTSSIHLLKR
jgi:hypothetical protein